MKYKAIFSILLLINSLTGFSQEDSLALAPAPEDKAVVYFIRTSGLGFAINFTYFDSATVIGRSNGTNYIRYECKPGYHLFWARSENRDFVEAELEAGKIYCIEAIPQMGAIKAGLKLRPVDNTNEKAIKRFKKLLSKKEAETFTAEELEKESAHFKEAVERGLEKYKEEKEKGDKITRLEKSQHL